MLCLQKNPTGRVLTQPVGFTIMYVIVNLQMLFRVLHIPADLLGVAVLFAEHAAAVLLHIQPQLAGLLLPLAEAGAEVAVQKRNTVLRGHLLGDLA